MGLRLRSLASRTGPAVPERPPTRQGRVVIGARVPARRPEAPTLLENVRITRITTLGICDCDRYLSEKTAECHENRRRVNFTDREIKDAVQRQALP